MTVKQALKTGFEALKHARLDVELLLSHALNKTRVWLLVHPEYIIPDENLFLYESFLRRRQNHEPLAYITEEKEFFGLAFIVSPHVLIPRPETELIAEEVIRIIHEKSIKKPFILDLGAGSGILPVSISKNIHDAKFIATDISIEALFVASQNAKKNGAEKQINFVNCDWFQGLNPNIKFDFIISNPPYIDEKMRDFLQKELDFEPQNALYSGKDGLEAIANLIENAYKFLQNNGILLIEIGSNQGESAKLLAKKSNKYKNIDIIKDMAGFGRVFKASVL
jgi:release factor glutamine methyltransferase